MQTTTPSTANLKAALKLIAQATQPQGIMLQPRPGAASYVFLINGTVLEARDKSGWRYWLQRDHGSKRGSIWYGTESRFDAAGREWQASLGSFVMDDFGALVPVGGAA